MYFSRFKAPFKPQKDGLSLERRKEKYVGGGEGKGGGGGWGLNNWGVVAISIIRCNFLCF